MLPGTEIWTDGFDVIWEETGPGRCGEGLFVLSSSTIAVVLKDG